MGSISQFVSRSYAPGTLVHFTLRGIGGMKLFLDDDDHAEFMGAVRMRLDRYADLGGPELKAFGNMPNHQHLLMRNGKDPTLTSKLIWGTSISYARSFNARHSRNGQLFQRPFRGKSIRSAEHLMNTFAYIHLNPDASLRTSNSSHGFYAGLVDDPHIDPTLAWKVFGGRAGYTEFFADTARLRQARAAAKYRLGQ